MSLQSRIAEALFLSDSDIASFAATAPYRYKTYTILKRNGVDERLIAQPAKEIKSLQRHALSLLMDSLPVHDCAMAYMKGRGIKENAGRHTNGRYLLKMDFKDFFNSITPAVFFGSLARIGISFSVEDIVFMSSLFFWKLRRNSPLRLSIGAPSSPLLSNVVMFEFDESMSRYCVENGITYTRYADDLTFSTNKKAVLFELPNKVKTLLRECYGLAIKVNDDKTVYTSKAFNRHVTGVTISNDGLVSLGRDRKRHISMLIHKFSINQLQVGLSSLQGLISFANDIEPDFIERMKLKYGEETILRIKSYRPEVNLSENKVEP